MPRPRPTPQPKRPHGTPCSPWVSHVEPGSLRDLPHAILLGFFMPTQPGAPSPTDGQRAFQRCRGMRSGDLLLPRRAGSSLPTPTLVISSGPLGVDIMKGLQQLSSYAAPMQKQP